MMAYFRTSNLSLSSNDDSFAIFGFIKEIRQGSFKAKGDGNLVIVEVFVL